MNEQTKTIDDGGPAFPMPGHSCANGEQAYPIYGISIRQYAAIHLHVPDSGMPWLDEMIEKARRDRFAGHALNGMASKNCFNTIGDLTDQAFDVSGVMIAARKETL